MSYSSANQQPRTLAQMWSTYTPLSCQGKDLQTRPEAGVWCLGLLSSATDGGVSVFYISSRVLCSFDEGPVGLAASFKCLFDVPSLSPSSQRECFLLDVAMSRWHESTFNWVMGSDEAVARMSLILVWLWASGLVLVLGSSLAFFILHVLDLTYWKFAANCVLTTCVHMSPHQDLRGWRRRNKSLLPLNVV